ncbi:MAG: AarF/ABC1/UbiB kinase family protein [Candidatus Shapirobacteria bacterium]|nr:AarF/ABC1/UbiB kinase family protein [Candidatus Shapirobacteria bacterium]
MFSKINRLTYLSFTIIGYLFLLIINRQKATSFLFNRFTKLGGIYIKFLQLLALNQNTISIDDPNNLQEILAVYDQAGFETIDITKILVSELKDKSSQITPDSLSPFAAGSFAQVYSGQLNGQPIVIKVLRPSVIKYLRFDLNFLSLIVKFVSLPNGNQMLDFVSVFNDFKNITLEEINYSSEVKNAVSFYKKMIGHSAIVIPQTYSDFCTDRLIIQEKIIGLPLTKIFSLDVPDKSNYILTNYQTDLNYIMEELATELLAGSLQNGGSHGDPHPGNIYILPDNKVALIDFGIGSSVQKHQSELLQVISQYVSAYKGEFNPEKICQAIIAYYAPYLTQSIQTVSTFYGKQDLVQKTLAELGKSAAQTLSQQGGDPALISLMDQYKILNIFSQVVNKNNRFAIKVSLDSPEFMRATQIFMKIIRLLGLDMQLLRRSWERVLNQTNFSQTSQAVANYDNESIDDSFHTLAVWFDKLHYSDPSLYNRVMQNWEVSL